MGSIYDAFQQRRQPSAARATSFQPTQPGDPNFSYATDPSSQAQYPAAAAEKRGYELQTRARNQMNDAAAQGFDVNSEEYAPVREALDKGFITDALTMGERLIGWIDGPRQFVNLFIQDMVSTENEASLSNYWDALWGGVADRDAFMAETGLDPVSGSRTLDLFGWDEEDDFAGRILRGIADFSLQVLTDPLTYVTFGASAVGKKVLRQAANTMSDGVSGRVLSAARGVGVDALKPYETGLLRQLDDITRTFQDDVIKNLDDDTVASLNGFFRDKHGITPNTVDETTDLAYEHIQELALRNRIADDVLKPLMRRDFRAINSEALELLPAYAHGGIRVSMPWSQRQLSHGIDIPGTRGLGRQLVGDPVRKLGERLKKFPILKRNFAFLENAGEHLDVDKALLKGLGRPVEKGGIAGWQYHIARNALDGFSNNAVREELKAAIGVEAKALFDEAEKLGVSDHTLVWGEIINRMESYTPEGSDFLGTGLEAMTQAGRGGVIPEHLAPLNAKIEDMAAKLNGVIREYYDKLAKVLPADQAKRMMREGVPHVISKEGQVVVAELAANVPLTREQLMAAGEGGVILAELLHAYGTGGRIEQLLGATRYTARKEIGVTTAAALIDNGTILINRRFLQGGKPGLPIINEGTLTGVVDRHIMSVTEINDKVEAVLKKLAEEGKIDLPKGFNGRLLNEDPLEVVSHYVDNMSEAIQVWQTIDSLKAAGLAMGHKVGYDIADMAQAMYKQIFEAAEQVTRTVDVRPASQRVLVEIADHPERFVFHGSMREDINEFVKGGLSQRRERAEMYAKDRRASRPKTKFHDSSEASDVLPERPTTGQTGWVYVVRKTDLPPEMQVALEKSGMDIEEYDHRLGTFTNYASNTDEGISAGRIRGGLGDERQPIKPVTAYRVADDFRTLSEVARVPDNMDITELVIPGLRQKRTEAANAWFKTQELADSHGLNPADLAGNQQLFGLLGVASTGKRAFRALRKYPVQGLRSFSNLGNEMLARARQVHNIVPETSKLKNQVDRITPDLVGYYDDQGRLISVVSFDTAKGYPSVTWGGVTHGGTVSDRAIYKATLEIMDDISGKELQGQWTYSNVVKMLDQEEMTEAGADMLWSYLNNVKGRFDDEALEVLTKGRPSELTRTELNLNEFEDTINEVLSGYAHHYDTATGQLRNPKHKLLGDEKFINLVEDGQRLAEELQIPGLKQIFGEANRKFMGLAETPDFVNPALFALGGPAASDLIVQKDVATWMRQLARNSATIYTPQGVASLKLQTNAVLRWWRGMATIARPAFHIRNLLGGSWNNMLINVRTQDYLAVRNHAMTIRSSIKSGKVTKFSEAIELIPDPVMRDKFKAAFENDVLSGFVTSEFRRLSGDEKAGRMAVFNLFDIDNFGLSKIGANFMESIEDFMRMSAFVRWYDPAVPGSAKVAKEMVEAVHFNYAKLTPFETRIKSIVPFFVWTRRNLPLQMAVFAENPRMMQRYRAMMQSMNDQFAQETEGELPEGDQFGAYAAGTSYYVNPGTPFWGRVMIDPDLPVKDFLNLPGLSPADMAEFATNLLGPQFSTILDINRERDLGDVNAPAPFNAVLKALSYVGLYDRTQDGDVRIPYWLRSVLETGLPITRDIVEPLMGGPTDTGRQGRLGIAPEDNGLESIIKGVGATLARGAGIKITTPQDARNVAARSQDELSRIIQNLRFAGQAPPSEG